MSMSMCVCIFFPRFRSFSLIFDVISTFIQMAWLPIALLYRYTLTVIWFTKRWQK